MPTMGRKQENTKRHGGMAAALFSATQRRVLGLLFGNPSRSFYATEVIGLSGGGSGAVQRELARLADSGLITISKVGNQKHYQANRSSPIFAELHGIALKTTGLAEPLRQALARQVNKIEAAFVYGSVAKGQDTASSDIDLMVISDALSYADVFGALEKTSNRLGRKVNPTVYTRQEWLKRIKERNAFVTRVRTQPRIWLIGGEDAIAP